MSQTKPIIQSLPEVWDGPIICLEMREDVGQVHLTQNHSASSLHQDLPAERQVEDSLPGLFHHQMQRPGQPQMRCRHKEAAHQREESVTPLRPSPPSTDKMMSSAKYWHLEIHPCHTVLQPNPRATPQRHPDSEKSPYQFGKLTFG